MKTNVYKTNRHSCYDLEYHLVVVTKYRHPVIIGEVKEQLISLSKRIFEEDWKCKISAINTDADHVHIMFEAPPQVQLSKLINNYKTVTSRILQKEFKDFLQSYYWKPYFWANSYFVCTVSERSHRIIEQYILDQGKD